MSFSRRASAFDLARRAGARYVGDNSADSAGLEEYMASGTYTPTVTTNGGATVAPVWLSGYSRVGNGAGAPMAGDTVTVFGAFSADGLVNGDTVSVSMPFEASFDSFMWCAATVVEGAGLSVVSSAFNSPVEFLLNMDAAAPVAGTVSFTTTYQTANAIDP